MTERERMKSVILDWMGRHDVVLREQAFTTLLQMMLELEGRRTTPDREAWISVDDRLPDDDSVVLISLWAYGKPDGERVIMIARFMNAEFLNEETGEEVYRPTHWMPLPTAPNGEKG